MKTVLITGCNGLVGSYLRDMCLNNGWKVIGVDRNSTKRITKNLNYTFKKLDLLSEINIINLFKDYKYDVVFNCFGIKGSPIKAKDNPADFLYPSFKINTEIINQCYFLHLGDNHACIAKCTKKIVFDAFQDAKGLRSESNQ